MKYRLLRGGAVACGVLISSLAWASEQKDPEQIDWPVQSLFLSDVPQIQEPGAVQGHASFRLRSTPEGAQIDAPLQGEVGLGRRLQLESEVQWSRERQEGALDRGVSEVGIGMHYGLMESSETGFALTSGLEGELARPEFSDDQWALHGQLLAFKQVGALGLNATLRPGFAYTRQEQLEPRAELGLGAAWGSGKFVPTGEVHAELGDETAFDAVGGFKFKPGQVVELGAGALVGRRGGDGVYGATTSLIIDLGG
jgi:hypothetical protein